MFTVDVKQEYNNNNNNFVPSLCYFASSLSLAFFYFLYFIHSLTYSLKTCSFTHLLIHSFAFLLYALFHVFSCASSFTELLFAHSLAFFPPYLLTCLLPTSPFTHSQARSLACCLPSFLTRLFIHFLAHILLGCLLFLCLHPSLVTTLVCSAVSFFPQSLIHALVRSLALLLTHSLTHLHFLSFSLFHLLARPLHFAFTHSLACLHVLSLTPLLLPLPPSFTHLLARSRTYSLACFLLPLVTELVIGPGPLLDFSKKVCSLGFIVNPSRDPIVTLIALSRLHTS